MYNIEKLYQSQRFQLTEVRMSGKKQTAGVLCFRGSPTKLDRTGKVVCAIEDGVVTTPERCYDPGSREFRRGRIVEIAGASGVSIAYGRLASANVRKGDMVRAGDPIGIEGNSGAGNGEYLTLEFRRNDRRVDGCGLLGIGSARPQEWAEPKGEPVRLIDANALLKHAYEVAGEHGSEAVVPVRCIMDAPVIEGNKMARWTAEDISTFWEMRRGGASLKEIADALGRTLSSVEQKSAIFNKSKEDTKMEVETNNTAPETKTEVNAPVEATDNPAPKLDGAIYRALDMIASQGLEFRDMRVSLNNDGASMELNFVRRNNHG